MAVATMPLLRAGSWPTIHEIARIDLALCDHRFLDDLASGHPSGSGQSPTAARDPMTWPRGRGPARHPCRRRDRGRRRGPDRLHLGYDRAARRRRCTSTGTCWRSPTRSPRRSLQPRRDDVFSGHTAAGVHLRPRRAGGLPAAGRRQHAADREGDPGRARATTSPTTASRSASRRRPPTGPCSRRATWGSWPPCGARCPRASTCARPTWHAFHDATGVKLIDGIGATEMLHVFISAADDDIRPGPTGRAVPGYEAARGRRAG